MDTVKEIENAVTTLSKDDLREFRHWFDDFDAKEWDDQLEDDVKNGRLDEFANKAIEDFENGNCTEL